MAKEWVLKGLLPDDPNCIQTAEKLEEYIDQIGFLPLFHNAVPGFSVEERTDPTAWWSDHSTRDPWQWRVILAERGNVAYGKLFHQKAAFVSREMFPYWANFRRDGYDFSSRWDDEKATIRQKRIMDLFEKEDELFSFQAKRMAGFGKNGEKNFDGTIAELQDMTYLLIRSFRRRINRAGEPYGWPIGVYCTPEHLWGDDLCEKSYLESPQSSGLRVVERISQCLPKVPPEQIQRALLEI